MLTGLDQAELLAENLTLGRWQPSAAVRQELVHLALSHGELTHLTTELFERLRKGSGQDIVLEYLGGIHALASDGVPAGARLLAAFLNVATPGERLLPLMRRLDSSRRYASRLAEGPGGLGPFQGDWLKRLEKLQVSAQKWCTDNGVAIEAGAPGHPRSREPWPLLRSALEDLLARTGDTGFAARGDGPELLSALLRLDVDAWQERTSLLAGSVHPFKVETVARVLPLLNRADSAVRDMRQLVAATAEGDYETAFVRPQARWREVFDDKDWNHLRRDLGRRPELAGLDRLAVGLIDRPIALPQLAAGTARIRALSAALAEVGVRSEPLDLFTACLLAQTHYGNGQMVFTIEPELAESIAAVLPPEAGDTAHPLHGLSVLSGLLVVDLPDDAPELEHGLPSTREATAEEEQDLLLWRRDHGLLDPTELAALQADDPTLAANAQDTDEDEDEEEAVDMDIAALKHLVLTNIQSVSVLLGFLRNAKVYSIPGLVEDVVNRTRNPQVIATIASDRALHTGFANKGVPLACLRSPVNVSVKTLRRFCHVKYVSKVDLKRLAADRTGIRKEVAREVQLYLEALT